MGVPDGRTILFLFKELREELPSSSHRAEVALFIAGKKIYIGQLKVQWLLSLSFPAHPSLSTTAF